MKFGVDTNRVNVLRFVKTDKDAIEPTKGSKDAAGYDLYAVCPKGELMIEPNKTVMVSTGIAMEIPSGYFGGVFARSGITTKKGLRPANCVGVIDADYRGSIIVALHNDSDQPQIINTGERIAQLVIIPCFDAKLHEVGTLEKTDRGDGGFGSTGE